MKRFLLVVLILSLCLGLVPAAFAAGANANADVHVEVHVDAHADAGAPQPCPPGPECTIIDGVPSCLEPPDYCGPTAEECRRRYAIQRNADIKDYARAVWEYLENELDRIGWACKTTHKFVRSYEVRVVYGYKGDNKHPENLTPVTFYCVDDPTIEESAYMVTKYGKKFHRVFFTRYINIGDLADEYNEEWLLSAQGQDGISAVDQFIKHLQSLSEGAGS